MGAEAAWKENMERSVPLEYVNWTQEEGIQSASPELGTTEECRALLLYGRSDLLFPGCTVLDAESTDSCLLSSALSEKLFGGKDTIGLTVSVQERKLEVRDIIESEEPFIAYEAGEQDVCSFDRGTVRYAPGEYSKTVEAAGQLFGEWKLADTRILVWTARIACFVMPCILCLSLLLMIRKYAKGANMSVREKMLWEGLMYLFLAGVFFFLLRKMQIPEDMIPTKWSDFDFWAEYGEKLKDSCQVLIQTEKKIPDLLLVGEYVRALGWGAAAAVGGILQCNKVHWI